MLACHCKGPVERFNIQMRHYEEDGIPAIDKIIIRLDNVVVRICDKAVEVDDQ